MIKTRLYGHHPLSKLGAGGGAEAERQAKQAPGAVVWEESAVSQMELPGLPSRAWGCEVWPRTVLRPEEPRGLAMAVKAGLLTFWDRNHGSPSLGPVPLFPPNALYTVEFVKGKKRGRDNPWACLQVHRSAKERHWRVTEMEAYSFGKNLVCKC